MITHNKLPGSLSGVGLGLPDFQGYWNALKSSITALQGLGYQISLHQQRLGNVKAILMARNDQNRYIMDDDIAKAADDLDKWWTVKGYMDKWLPSWMSAAASPSDVQLSGSSGLGFIILPIVAIVALAYCVNVGMALLQDYQIKMNLTQDVIEKKITAGQAAEVLSIPRVPGAIETTIKDTLGSVGLGLGFGIPTALLVGGGIYLLYTTGVLNKMVSWLPSGDSAPVSGG